VQTLCVQQDAENRSPHRQLRSITTGTVVTEKTLINANRSDYGMDGMDAISSSRHKPPSRINTPGPGLSQRGTQARDRVLGLS
jgi:hypothetical protein